MTQWAFGEFGKDTPGTSQALLYYGVSFFGCPGDILQDERLSNHHSLRFLNKTSGKYSNIFNPPKDMANVVCATHGKVFVTLIQIVLQNYCKLLIVRLYFVRT